MYAPTLQNTAQTAAAARITHVSLLSGDPGATGTANNVATARVVPTKTVATVGTEVTVTIVATFTGLTAGQSIWGVAYWDAAGTGVPASGGTYLGRGVRTTGDATANAQGQATVTIVETMRALDA